LLAVDPEVFRDAHEREHAMDINRRFANGRATTGQIVLFGLTGGLIPCPASITVLLLCLQVGKFALGAALVLCFSIGLALTMVLVGVAAALSLRHLSGRWKGFDTLSARAPYVSGALIALVGVYTLYLGFSALA
jgi:nickel/cobalt exporter